MTKHRNNDDNTERMHQDENTSTTDSTQLEPALKKRKLHPFSKFTTPFKSPLKHSCSTSSDTNQHDENTKDIQIEVPSSITKDTFKKPSSAPRSRYSKSFKTPFKSPALQSVTTTTSETNATASSVTPAVDSKSEKEHSTTKSLPTKPRRRFVSPAHKNASKSILLQQKYPELKYWMDMKSNLDAELKELNNLVRNAKLVQTYHENDEPSKVDSLIQKWQSASQSAAELLRSSWEQSGLMEQMKLNAQEQNQKQSNRRTQSDSFGFGYFDSFNGNNDRVTMNREYNDEEGENPYETCEGDRENTESPKTDDSQSRTQSQDTQGDQEIEVTYKWIFEKLNLDIGLLNYNEIDDCFQ